MGVQDVNRQRKAWGELLAALADTAEPGSEPGDTLTLPAPPPEDSEPIGSAEEQAQQRAPADDSVAAGDFKGLDPRIQYWPNWAYF